MNNQEYQRQVEKSAAAELLGMLGSYEKKKKAGDIKFIEHDGEPVMQIVIRDEAGNEVLNSPLNIVVSARLAAQIKDLYLENDQQMVAQIRVLNLQLAELSDKRKQNHNFFKTNFKKFQADVADLVEKDADEPPDEFN